MTISKRVICSVAAPLLVYLSGMLPAAQAVDKTESVHVQEVTYIASEAPTLRQQTASRSAKRVALANNIVKTGDKYLGTPYCHGGTNPRCFDCSGFTKYVYAKNGIFLPRVANAQLSHMHRVSRKNAKPGDLVFFINRHGHAYHVGIYIGNNRILHSPKPHRRVKTERIWTSNVVFATIR